VHDFTTVLVASSTISTVNPVPDTVTSVVATTRGVCPARKTPRTVDSTIDDGPTGSADAGATAPGTSIEPTTAIAARTPRAPRRPAPDRTMT